MEAKELRIGNKIYRVFKTHKQVVEVLDLNEPRINFVSADNFIPIPLTAEILAKTGADVFERDVCFIFKIKKQGEFIVFPGTSLVGQANGVGVDDYYYFLNGVIIIIKHLHQLQNLYFALTGEELQIKL